MNNVVQLPYSINYRVYGMERGGSITVECIGTGRRFTMTAREILANTHLSRQFPIGQVNWLCQIAKEDRELQKFYQHNKPIAKCQQ